MWRNLEELEDTKGVITMNRRRTDNTMPRRQPTIYETLLTNLKIEQRDLFYQLSKLGPSELQ